MAENREEEFPKVFVPSSCYKTVTYLKTDFKNKASGTVFRKRELGKAVPSTLMFWIMAKEKARTELEACGGGRPETLLGTVQTVAKT